MRKNMFRKLLMLLTVLAVSLHGAAALAASAVDIPPVEQRAVEIDPIAPRSHTAESTEFMAWDGEITADENEDFSRICGALRKMSIASNTLMLWLEKRLQETD